MFRPLRTLISLAVLAGMVWFSFAVELGDKTLAEHVDTISATPEAQELLEGTRQTIDPALSDVRDRMLGEYVEAPTYIAEEEIVPASTLDSGRTLDDEPALPGRRSRPKARVEVEDVPEPARPGRRLRPNALATVELEPVVEPAPANTRPIEPPRLPWSHPSQDHRSFLDPMRELALSRPTPEPTPIPIAHPEFDPALPELPASR